MRRGAAASHCGRGPVRAWTVDATAPSAGLGDAMTAAVAHRDAEGLCLLDCLIEINRPVAGARDAGDRRDVEELWDHQGDRRPLQRQLAALVEMTAPLRLGGDVP